MCRSLKICLAAVFLATTAMARPIFAEPQGGNELIRRLREGLNSATFAEISDLFVEEKANVLKNDYRNFLVRFPDAKWRIISSGSLNDSSPIVEVFITGNRQSGD